MLVHASTYIMDAEEITKHLTKTNLYEVVIFAKDGQVSLQSSLLYLLWSDIGNLVLEQSSESKDVTVVIPGVTV